MTSIICMLLQRMLFGFVAALPLATTPAHPARAACEQMVRPPPRPALHCDSLEVARPARTRGASPAASPAHPFRPIHTGRIHSRDSRAGPDLASRGAPCRPHGVRPQLGAPRRRRYLSAARKQGTPRPDAGTPHRRWGSVATPGHAAPRRVARGEEPLDSHSHFQGLRQGACGGPGKEALVRGRSGADAGATEGWRGAMG